MTEINKDRIENLIENGYQFKLGEYLNQGISFLSDHFIKVFLTTLIGSMIPLLNIITSPNIYRAYLAIDQKNSNEFEELFNFKKTGQILLFILMIFAIEILLVLPFFILGGWNFSLLYSSDFIETNGVNKMLIITLIIYFCLFCLLNLLLSTCIYYVYPLILFGNYSATEAFQTSYRLAKSKIPQIFILNLIIGLFIFFLSFFCYFVGILFIPLAFTVYYASFKDLLFEKDFDKEINEIGENYSN